MPTRKRFGRRRSGFGDAGGGAPSSSSGTGVKNFLFLNVEDQESALEWLTQHAAPDTMNPAIRRAALTMVRGCAERDDLCELRAIYNAVKYGDSQVAGLERGLKYMADNFYIDTFTAPATLLEECENGDCAGDCDDHASLMLVLAGSLGFRCGLRAWGLKGSGGYQHVYCVVLFPKEDEEAVEYGLDTSADAGDVDADGWQPPSGNIVTAWVEPSDVTMS